MDNFNVSKVTICRRENCPVNKGGPCLDDIEYVEDCQFAITTESIKKEEFLTIPQGIGLSLVQADALLKKRKINTVSMIGAIGSGKTTFLAVLFHRFFRDYNGFNNHYFMDTETILGLNRKLHFAVLKSGNSSVQMPRTSSHEEPVFHFKTKDHNGKINENFWFDIPGDSMEPLSKGIAGWERFSALKNSTHVMLFLDLSVISNPQERGPHVQQALDVLANSIQAKIWNGRKLLVVFSKSDKYLDNSRENIKKIKINIEDRFLSDFEKIEYCELHSLAKKINDDDAVRNSLIEVWDWVYA